mmetsp:Transcript_14256/g.38662  ORF Transcript_14256/g.38662 Transcript_14256/m.38662 type:complete len:106 (-) Transcript_14256:398-715(-)
MGEGYMGKRVIGDSEGSSSALSEQDGALSDDDFEEWEEEDAEHRPNKRHKKQKKAEWQDLLKDAERAIASQPADKAECLRLYNSLKACPAKAAKGTIRELYKIVS